MVAEHDNLERDVRTRPVRRRELSFGLGLIAVTIGLLAQNGVEVAVLVTAPIVVISSCLLVRNATALGVIVLANYPYAVGAYLAASNGVRFYPRPPLEVYEEVANLQVSLLLIAFGVGLAVGLGSALQDALERGWRTLKKGLSFEVGAPWFPLVVGLILGLHDTLFLLSNLHGVLASNRHSHDSEFWVATSPFGIVAALSVSASLVMGCLATSRRRWISVAALALMWLPSLVAGARNYLSVLAVTSLTLLFVALRTRKIKVVVALGAGLFIWLFALVPSTWSSNSLVVFNEWILPTSSFLPLFLHQFTVVSVGATPFFAQWPLMLPSVLRPYAVHPYGDVFAGLGLTNVGVGGNPWADTFGDSGAVQAVLFVGSFLFILWASIRLGRFHPLVPALAVGLMFFWGRSTFWNTLFIVVYCTVAMVVFLPRKIRAVDERIP